jgi:hypothetical protein
MRTVCFALLCTALLKIIIPLSNLLTVTVTKSKTLASLSPSPHLILSHILYGIPSLNLHLVLLLPIPLYVQVISLWSRMVDQGVLPTQAAAAELFKVTLCVANHSLSPHLSPYIVFCHASCCVQLQHHT